MAHLALFPVLLLNVIPTSVYQTEKEGKSMRLEVGRKDTTAPAQKSTKFSSIFKLPYLKPNQNRTNPPPQKKPHNTTRTKIDFFPNGESIFPPDRDMFKTLCQIFI